MAPPHSRPPWGLSAGGGGDGGGGGGGTADAGADVWGVLAGLVGRVHHPLSVSSGDFQEFGCNFPACQNYN